MPGVARLGDICTGHGCWPPRPNVMGSPDVFCNGRPVHRMTDAWAVHCCCPIPEAHDGVLADGAHRTLTNWLPTGRCGDPVSCGSVVATCSHDTFACQ